MTHSKFYVIYFVLVENESVRCWECGKLSPEIQTALMVAISASKVLLIRCAPATCWMCVYFWYLIQKYNANQKWFHSKNCNLWTNINFPGNVNYVCRRAAVWYRKPHSTFKTKTDFANASKKSNHFDALQIQIKSHLDQTEWYSQFHFEQVNESIARSYGVCYSVCVVWCLLHTLSICSNPMPHTNKQYEMKRTMTTKSITIRFNQMKWIRFGCDFVMCKH